MNIPLKIKVITTKYVLDMEGEGEYCIKVYPLERGIVMKVDRECNILVGDISTPP